LSEFAYKYKYAVIILARGGSKELPRKNLALLAGKPLLQWAIDDAKMAGLKKIYVSTDDDEIASFAKSCGSKVIRRLPREANDTATTEDSIRVTVDRIEGIKGSPDYKWDEIVEEFTIENELLTNELMTSPYDGYVFLQCTDLFRTEQIIERCIQHFELDPYVDSVFAVKPVFKNYWRAKEEGAISSHKRLASDIPYGPRQTREPLFEEYTGLCLVSKPWVFKQRQRVGHTVGVEVVKNKCFDIHNQDDLEEAERWWSKNGN